MKQRRNTVVISASCALLSACATNPPVEVRYYPPRLDILVTDARSVGCDKQDVVHIADTVTTSAVYSGDRAHPQFIKVHDFDGAVTNTDMGVTLTDDGRLSGFNVTEAGQGAQIAEAVLAVAATAAAAASSDTSAVHNACDYINQNGKDKVMTLTFAAKEAFDKVHDAVQMQPIVDDKTMFTNLEILTGDVCLITKAPTPATSAPINYAKGTRDDVELPMNEPAPITMSVIAVNPAECGNSQNPHEIWSATAQVPQLGVPYMLPVPKARAFGTRSVTLALNNAGAITSLKYGSQSGAADALGVVNKAIPLFQGDSDADKAADLKAKADVIAQQERLVRCKSNPSACT